MKNTAIVLAGGRGSRMKSDRKKQYLPVNGKPVLYYSLQVFQNCSSIEEIILVCGQEDIADCQKEIVDYYGFTKVSQIVPGGAERYHSVYEGLKAASDCKYVLIHDGARPFIDEAMIDRILECLKENSACVVGMPVKDTIKLSAENGYVAETLPREKLWMIQTPQSFEYKEIRKAYDELMQKEKLDVKITDDAMVAEYISNIPVKLIEGSYENIKITTPGDLIIAEAIAKKDERFSPQQ